MPNKVFFNKKASFEYKFVETYEAGIILNGYEIKALRAGRVSITGSHAKIINGEIFWLGALFQVVSGDPQRTRKLLLNKKEINRLIGKVQQDGYTVVPKKLYFKKGKAKLEIALAQGMKKYEKREKLKKRDISREIERQTKY